MTGYYVDEENNNIVIELKDLDTQKVEAFKELFSDDSCIVFEKGEQVTETTGWRPGRKIYTPSSSMSTGYRAYWYSPSGKKYKGNSLTGDTFTYSYICKIVNNQLRTGAYLY